MFRNVFVFTVLTMATALATGCDPKGASAVRDGVRSPQEIQRYEPEVTFGPDGKLAFQDSAIFFWKVENTPEHFYNVITSSLEIDKKIDEKVAIRAKRKKLEPEFEAKELNAPSLENDVDMAETQKKEFQEILDKLKGKLAEEEAKAQPDQQKLGQLKKDIARRQNQVEEQDQAIADVAETVAKAELTQQWTAWMAARQELKANAARVEELAAKINQSTDFSSIPAGAVVFTHEGNGQYSAEIAGWALDPTQQTVTYSTADGSIQNFAYNAWGGTFSFDVITARGSFNFRISRARPDAPDGRKYFKGNIVGSWTNDDGKVITRKGVAKFVDKKDE